MSKKIDWKDSVVYQIYPRSFSDSNSDGIGDIKGIISKLSYLENLGINVIWLSPVYSSPNDDNGYDISDYYNINTDFGTMADMDELLSESKKHGIRILMDLVVNHTSDEHEWFKQAKSDKNNKYHDYYIWSKDEQKPNNWRSFFQGSVWELNKSTNENYLHLFSKKQPDLNWENREMRNEIYTMMKWWLDKGVGGFRLDVFNVYAKPDLYSSAPGIADSNGFVFNPGHYANNDGIHEIMQEMNEEVFSNYDCLTVGEAVEINPTEAINYVQSDKGALNMVFHFEIVSLEDKSTKNMKKVLKNWIPVMNKGGWNSNYLSNHDNPRQVSVFGNDDKYLKESATLLATMNFTLPGTPYIYQGEEIGMTNMLFNSFSQFNDIETINGIKSLRNQGKDDDFILNYFREKSRDNSRTPIQWDNSLNAGFTDGKPWLDVNPNYTEINTENQIHDDKSIFTYYQELISLRKQFSVLTHGDSKIILEKEEDLIAYKRTYKNETMYVLLNRSDNETVIKSHANLWNNNLDDSYILDNLSFLSGNNSLDGIVVKGDEILLKPWQSIIVIEK